MRQEPALSYVIVITARAVDLGWIAKNPPGFTVTQEILDALRFDERQDAEEFARAVCSLASARLCNETLVQTDWRVDAVTLPGGEE